LALHESTCHKCYFLQQNLLLEDQWRKVIHEVSVPLATFNADFGATIARNNAKRG
jgi:hypothetical protein